MSTFAATRLFHHLAADNHRPALVVDGRTISYALLAEYSRAVAGGLETLNVRRGDRVATYLSNNWAAVALLLACHRLGAIYVPINRRYQRAELAHILADCRPAAIASDPQGVAFAHELPHGGGRKIVVGQPATEAQTVPGEVSFDSLLAAPPYTGPAPRNTDDAIMIYTSGTTGASKGVTHSFAGLVANMEALTRGWGVGTHDRLSLALPLFHVHGLCIGIHGSLLQGTTILLSAAFDPVQVVDDFSRRGATVFMGVPTMYVRLLEHLRQHPPDATPLQRARLFTAGSAALSPETFAEFRERTGHEILERYGMSETLITLSNPLDGPRRVGTVGRPVDGCEVAIVDDDGTSVQSGQAGELLVRGNSLMTGYFGAPEATQASFDTAGWFRTGDMAQFDSAGYVRLLGRRSTDLIKSGGYRIAAREIEEVLASDPLVREVAVVGLPDPTWGQRIAAVVVPESNASPAELDAQLRATCREQLADYKCPRRIEFVTELPRNALGKIQKHRLVDMFGQDPSQADFAPATRSDAVSE